MYEKRYSNMADSERVKLESDVEDSYDIYPHPTVRVVRPNVRVIGHSSWKEALTEVTRRKAFLGFLAVLVFLLLLIIVVVFMVQGKAEDDTKHNMHNQKSSKYGLVSYPSVEQGGVISFKPDDYNTYWKWMDQLEEALHPYTPQKLSSQSYIQCDIRDRKAGQQCTFHIYDLGRHCSHGKDFGYSIGKPCILLQLRLPFHPGMVEKDSDTWKKMYNVLGTRWNPDFVSVTCDGKTQEDKDNLRLHNNDTAVTFTPSSGFLARFFPSDLKDDLYLAPIMMVQFRSVKLFQEIAVECIAWAQQENGTLPSSSELYRTEFKLMVH